MHDSAHTVFISFHAANADAAQALASLLRSSGASVRCDTPGTSVDDGERLASLLQANVVVAWLSIEHCLDAQLQREFIQAFAASSRHPAKERIVLIDALDADEAALPRVLRSACDILRPDQVADHAEQIALHALRLRDPIGSISSCAPAEPRVDIAPRTGQLWHIHEALASAPAAHRVVQLVGDAGSGKSWLAGEYERLFRAAYPGGVFRVDAGWFEQPDAAQLRTMCTLAWREVSASVGLDVGDDSQIAAELQRRLDENGAPYLWIVDHMPGGQSLDDVSAWLARSARGSVLLISRTREYAELGAQIDLAALDHEEARTLLERQKPMATPQEAAAGRQLIEQLGAHPLAIHLAASRLARSTYDRMLLQLAAPAREAAQLADGLAAVLPHPQLVGIAVSIQRSIARLSAQARQALRIGSVLAAAPIPAALLTTALAQQVRSGASQNSVSQTQLAIDELLGFGLAQRIEPDSLVITPLIRAAALSSEADSDLGAARSLLSAVLAGELPQAMIAERSNPYWRWIPHVLHLTRTAAPSPQLLEINGWLARFDAALGTLRSSNRRAIALLEQGDASGALHLLDMELAARRLGLGEDHPQTVTPVNNLGVALSLRGDFPRARSLFEQAIEVRRKALGDAHIDLLTPLNNLGVVLWHEGEHAKARKLFEKVVELRRHLLGDRHPDTLVSMRNLAVALRHDGEYVAARNLLEHVVEVRGASLGNQHADTCTAMASLAETLREQSEAILARISDKLSIDNPLLGHEGVRIARA